MGIIQLNLDIMWQRQIVQIEDWVEFYSSPIGTDVWAKLWKLKVPNKIKVFKWRACQNILPTRINLVRRRIIEDETCEFYLRAPKSMIHVSWECGVAQDIWASSFVRLQ